jgi:phosphate transport system protein
MAGGGARKALQSTATERKALAQALDKLFEHMVTLAELAELAIRKAADSLERNDPQAADDVFTLDNEVYALQIQIERSCAEVLALYAPVARDLRLITTSLKITTDLDRIGRYAKDIAEIALQLRGGPEGVFDRLPSLPKMVSLTIEMVDTATEAFVRRDAESVRDMQVVDDQVDRLHDETFESLVASMKDGSLDIEVGTRYVLVARYLERIADHAVNIGERVVYMVTGERVPRVRAADRARGTDGAKTA